MKPGFWVSSLGRNGFWAVYANEPDGTSTLEEVQGNRWPNYVRFFHSRPVKAWMAAYCIFLLLICVHAAFLWAGSILSKFEPLAMYGIVESSSCPETTTAESLGDRKRRAVILSLGALLPAAGLIFLSCVWSGTRQKSDPPSDLWLLGIAFGVPVLITGLSLGAVWVRHCERGVALVGGVTLAALLVCGFFPRYWFPNTDSLLVSRRIMALTSGVSPVVPVLFLVLAGVCACWYELRGMALVDVRRPRLPKGTTPSEFDRMDDIQAEKIRKSMRPLEIQWRIVIPPALVIPLVIGSLNWRILRPFQTLDGSLFDLIFGLMFWMALVLFTGCVFKIVATWSECRVLLSALDRRPLRDAFKRLKEFSWGPLWSLGGVSLQDSYKFVSRQIECLEHLSTSLENESAYTPSDQYVEVQNQIKEAKKQLGLVRTCYEYARKDFEGANQDLQLAPNLMEAYALLQIEIGKLTGLVIRNVLSPMWQENDSPVSSAIPADLIETPTNFQVVAEEFVSLTYANFLVTVLVRLRTMVVCGIGMYVFILLSMSSYPFSPSPSVFIVAISLILLLVSVIGIVYAQMHREATLSRLTDTQEGELGADFWVQFASAGALPILTLLASQFPEIGRIVYSFLQPLTQSIK